MAGSLKGPLDKFWRAEAQLDELREEIERAFPDEKRWPVRSEIDGTGREYRFYIAEMPRVGAHWPLAVGEILFNFRASLDHLVYELHVRRFKGKVPRKVEGTSQFPIYTSIGEFNRCRYRIKCLSQRDRRVLGYLQPYETGRDKWQPVRYALRRLNTLHNIDKHRQLHLVAAANYIQLMPEFKFGPLYGLHAKSHPGAVEPHSPVETWTWAVAPPPRKVALHPGVMLEVAIQDRGKLGEPVLLSLTQISIGVRQVLDRFANRFER